jgi:hypothetical protein
VIAKVGNRVDVDTNRVKRRKERWADGVASMTVERVPLRDTVEYVRERVVKVVVERSAFGWTKDFCLLAILEVYWYLTGKMWKFANTAQRMAVMVLLVVQEAVVKESAAVMEGSHDQKQSDLLKAT